MARNTDLIIARPYAKALLAACDSSLERNKSLNELEKLLKMTKIDSNLSKIFEGFQLNKKQTEHFLRRFLGYEKGSSFALKTVLVLARNGRIAIFETFVSIFRELVEQAEGQIRAELVVASHLGEESVAALSDAFADICKANVNLNVKVDANLIAGVVVNLGSFTVDTSVRTKLEQLSHLAIGVNLNAEHRS